MNYINLLSEFRAHYQATPGHHRRAGLLACFKKMPFGLLPVNCKWQARTDDPDLGVLIKRGILVQIRGGAGARHHMNKTSSKRQSYLVLAKAHGGQREEVTLGATATLKVQMQSALDSTGWVSRLPRTNLRVGSRAGTFGRTYWLLRSGEDVIEVIQVPNRPYTTSLVAPTDGQLRLVEQLISVGVATAKGQTNSSER